MVTVKVMSATPDCGRWIVASEIEIVSENMPQLTSGSSWKMPTVTVALPVAGSATLRCEKSPVVPTGLIWNPLGAAKWTV